MSSRFSPISDYPHSPVVEQIIERIERITSGNAQRADMFEVIWPGMDKHLKAFVAPADAPGLYRYEIKIGKRVVLLSGPRSQEQSRIETSCYTTLPGRPNFAGLVIILSSYVA